MTINMYDMCVLYLLICKLLQLLNTFKNNYTNYIQVNLMVNTFVCNMLLAQVVFEVGGFCSQGCVVIGVNVQNHCTE